MFSFQDFYFHKKKRIWIYILNLLRYQLSCLLSSSVFIKSCFLLGNIRMYIEDITVDELVQAVNVCWCGRISMRNVRLQRSDSLTRKAQGLSQRWTSETSWLLSRVICLPRRSMTILLRSVEITFFFAFFLPYSSVLKPIQVIIFIILSSMWPPLPSYLSCFHVLLSFSLLIADMVVLLTGWLTRKGCN